jgi:hypothetical protein
MSSCSFQISGTPTMAGTFGFTVTLRDSLGDQAQAAITLAVNAGTPPQITTTTYDLSNNRATIGISYSFKFNASGGTPPYQWSVIGSAPDPGLQLSSAGTLSGVTTLTNDCLAGPARFPQKASFQVRVTDAVNQTSVSGQLCLPSYWPAPQVSSINPSSISLDGQTSTVTISGSNFRSNAVIYANYTFQLPAQYVNSSTLTLSIVANPANWVRGSPYTIDVFQSYSDLSNMDKTITFH